MRQDRSEYSPFVQKLDKTAEKNPLLWLPCVILLSVIIGSKRLCENVRIAFSRPEEKPAGAKLYVPAHKKPIALRAAAAGIALSFGLMFVSDLGFIAYADAAETEIAVIPTDTEYPAVTTVTEETSETEEPTVTTVTEETSETEEPATAQKQVSGRSAPISNGILLSSSNSEDHRGHQLHSWDADDDYHWRYCETCHREVDRAPHYYPLVSYIAPTDQNYGKKIYRCVCGMEKNRIHSENR